MSGESIREEDVLKALSTVIEPELHQDLVSLNFIRNINIEGPEVSFTIMLTTPACPLKNRLQRESEQALREHIPEIGKITVEFDSEVRADRRISEKLHVPIKTILAVGSGKGGVGKTTVAVNLAASLALDGAATGLLDADIYGPNIPLMTGIREIPPSEEGKLVPARAHGLQVMSMGFLIPEGEALVWRGPMIHTALRQLFADVLWDELDYLVVDLPPGTGDAQLSLAQLVPLTGGIVVTTPQEVSLSDARRGVRAFQRLKVPVLGIIENMAGEIFGAGGGQRAAAELDLPFLASIPLEPTISRGSDSGSPPVSRDPDGELAQMFRTLARVVAGRLSVEQYRQAG
jgi:ATP-binding protein involved in chromosome partitioning